MPLMPRRRADAFWDTWLGRGYDNLDIPAFACLLVLVLIGCALTLYGADAVVICLQFGKDAYFRDGVRAIHHDFFSLSNGQKIAPRFRLIFTAIWAISFVAWNAAALFIVVRINEYFERRRKRKT
jgi:hypothetical protein